MEDLEKVITFNHEALSLCPPGYPYYPSSLNNLADANFTRFEQSRISKRDDQIQPLSTRSLSSWPPTTSSLTQAILSMVSLLATGSRVRWRIVKRGSYVIVKYSVFILLATHNVPPPLNNVAAAVNARYVQSSRIEDLGAVLIYDYEALTLCPPGHPDHSNSLCSLASAILSRYELYGRLEELKEGDHIPP